MMQLSEFETKIVEALDDCTGGVKHCGKSAVTHLKKAWAIRDVDSQMAVFRGITAEEEAASSVFYSLKNCRYNNASRLLFKKHTYKLALYPFAMAVWKYLADTLGQDKSPLADSQISHVVHNNRRALELAIRIKGKDVLMHPNPPLHFGITNTEDGSVYTFPNAFKETLSNNSYKNVLAYVKDIANRRNLILYATPEGQPKVSGDIEQFIRDQKRKVFVLLGIVLLSDPWYMDSGRSGFVQQALDAFLLLLERISQDDISAPIGHPGRTQ